MVGGCEFSPGTSPSVCEAMCSWAVACHDQERSIDADVLRETCLSATYGVDPTCQDTDIGALSFAGIEELTPCIEAVDDRRRGLECDPFTGTGSAIESGTPPAQCIGAGRDAGAVFEAARDATVEPSEALCDRFADGVCGATAACIAGAFGGAVPNELVDELGDPAAVCAMSMDSAYTAPCRGDGRYDPQLDGNVARDAARACLAGPLTEPDCTTWLDGNLDPVCDDALAGASELAQVSEAIVMVAEAFLDVP